MKQLILATLLLIAACITFSTVSNQINMIVVKDQQIEVLKEMLQESNDRELGARMVYWDRNKLEMAVYSDEK